MQSFHPLTTTIGLRHLCIHTRWRWLVKFPSHVILLRATTFTPQQFIFALGQFIAMASSVDPVASQILEYWFGPGFETAGKWCKVDEAVSKKWFGGGPAVDEEIITKFSDAYAAMSDGKLDGWLEHPINALAGVILLDQYSRNMFRGSSKTYDLDAKALTWAKHLLDGNLPADINRYQRFFLYMPYEHSEDVKDQERCVQMFKESVAEAKAAVEAGDKEAESALKFFEFTYQWAIYHWEVVDKWGRFPHRNVILGRESTPEEIAGLADGTIRKF